VARRFADDPVAQILLERHARREGLSLERERDGPLLRYRFVIDVPAYDDERLVTVEFADSSRPHVYIDGPVCVRHRYNDGSVCMWFASDPPERRWVATDGLLELARHAAEHAYCEAECRAGRAWPKAEAPGDHPRPSSCPTCHGRCS